MRHIVHPFNYENNKEVKAELQNFTNRFHTTLQKKLMNCVRVSHIKTEILKFVIPVSYQTVILCKPVTEIDSLYCIAITTMYTARFNTQ